MAHRRTYHRCQLTATIAYNADEFKDVYFAAEQTVDEGVVGLPHPSCERQARSMSVPEGAGGKRARKKQGMMQVDHCVEVAYVER